MSRVITFSRTFPSYHPRKGEPTYFVEKILLSLSGSEETSFDDGTEFHVINLKPKHHTIRAGHRWKVGDKFSPSVWSGKPYNSKQITIAPDMEIKKVWSFSIGLAAIYIDQQRWIDKSFIAKVAANDGLDLQSFLDWFQYPKPFTGQIICWNENINY